MEMPLGRLTHVGPRNRVLDVGSDPPPHEKGHFWGGHVPANCNVPTHECTAHCALAAVKGDTAMRPLAKLLWTPVTY